MTHTFREVQEAARKLNDCLTIALGEHYQMCRGEDFSPERILRMQLAVVRNAANTLADQLETYGESL